MKKLLYALTAVAMLTGCESDVVDSEINKEAKPIGFSTYKNIYREVTRWMTTANS